MEKIQVEKEHFCTSVSFSCHNEHAWHKRALEKKEAASSSEYTRVIQTTETPKDHDEMAKEKLSQPREKY